MKLRSIGTIIAEREYDIEGSQRKINVIVGKPEKMPGSEDFYCPYKIEGIGSEKINYSAGVDSVQALLNTLKSIGAELYCSKAGSQGLITWLGMQIIDFSVAENLKDLEENYSRISKLK